MYMYIYKEREANSEVTQPCPTPWTVDCLASLFMEFSRQEYWNGLPFPSPGHLPDPVIKPWSPILQTDSSLSKPPGKPIYIYIQITVMYT